MANFTERLNSGMKYIFGGSGSNDPFQFNSDYPFAVKIESDLFIEIKIIGLYKRILTQCIKRSIWNNPNKDAIERSFYDSFENSENVNGLVSFIATAMFKRTTKALVWKHDVLREATKEEENLINKDYKTVAKSNNGIIINFKNYNLTKILIHYYAQMWTLNMARNTTVNIAAALKIGVDGLREMVNASNAEDAVKQAKLINDALKNGKSVLTDSKDNVGTLGTVDVGPLVSARDQIYSEMSQDTGLPVSFISGEPTSGASILGDADLNRESDALEEYWLSIWKPIIKNLYKVNDISYRNDRWRMLESKLRSVAIMETLETLTEEEKRKKTEEILELKNEQKKPEKV
jgi:hypothetical protein